jgi:dTDP-glucose 4,6-dehydratase
LDALTYAVNLENLNDIENKENCTFIKGDITDETFIEELLKVSKKYGKSCYAQYIKKCAEL